MAVKSDHRASPSTMKGGALLLLCLLAALPVMATENESDSRQEEMSSVLERFRQILHRTEAPAPDGVDLLVKGLDPNGRWPDIDYGDRKTGKWDPLKHVERLRDLALAFSDPEAAESRRSELQPFLLRALDHWLAERHQSDNWWFNQIGVPRFMRDVAVLLEGQLEKDRWTALLEVVDQHDVRGTGANLLWAAELALHYGCLTARPEAVRDAAEKIRGEIAVGRAEGIQEDWSFFQHGARLQTFHYGLAFMEIAAQIGWQLRGTSWAFSAEENTVLSNYIMEGMQWMMRGSYTIPSTMDRKASRPNALRIKMADSIRLWSEVDAEARPRLETFLQRLQGKKAPPDGFRHFPAADFTAYHRPHFSFFLKTISDRTHLTERINRENLLGRHLNTGDHYLLTTGVEYFNLLPVWDWDRLPGIITADNAGPILRQPFTGGIGDGASGMTAMDTWRGQDKSQAPLKVRRSWFFHQDIVVALVGGWEVEEDAGEPFTVLDQSRLSGDVYAIGSSQPVLLPEGGHELDAATAILHGDVAWISFGADSLSVRSGPARGSWRRINSNRSDEELEVPVFLAAMHHGSTPGPAGFALAPGADPRRVREILNNPPWTVIRNDREAQAVEFTDRVAMAAFFGPGSVSFGAGEVAVSKPCLVFKRGDSMLVADPTHTGGKVEVRLDGVTRTIQLPDRGRAAQWP